MSTNDANNQSIGYTLNTTACLVESVPDGQCCLVFASLKHYLAQEAEPSPDLNLHELFIQHCDGLSKVLSMKDCPSSLTTCCISEKPLLAVAQNDHVLFLNNFVPCKQFVLPLLEADPEEHELWQAYTNHSLSAQELQDKVKALKQTRAIVSPLLNCIEQLKGEQQVSEFFANPEHLSLEKQDFITVLESLRCDMEDMKEHTVLVIGTEEKIVYVLDSSGVEIISKTLLPAAPTEIVCYGYYNQKYSIIVACRNGVIYQIRKKAYEITSGIETDSLVVSLGLCRKTIVAACVNATVKAFSLNGRSLYTISLDSRPICMCIIQVVSKDFEGIAVATANGGIHVYKNQDLVSVVRPKSTDPASKEEQGEYTTAMKFGRFLREDNVLVGFSSSGMITAYFLKRTAKLDATNKVRTPARVQAKPLDLPQKSNLFIDLAKREKDQYQQIHQKFIGDLATLKIETAEEYLRLLSLNPHLMDQDGNVIPIQLQARVMGLGPLFSLNLTVTRLGNLSLLMDSQEERDRRFLLLLTGDEKLYHIKTLIVELPMLIPSIAYAYTVDVEALSDTGLTGQITVTLMESTEMRKISTVMIDMPMAEPLVWD